MFIINAKLYTMEAAGIIECGYVAFCNGKITAIGDMANFDTAALDEIYDAQGGILIPGMIDAHSHIGMFDDSLDFEGDDGNEDTDPATPQLSALDAVYANDICFKEALLEGVTTVITGPGSANPIGGMLIAMKTHGSFVDDMIVKSPVAMKFALGENPKVVYHGKNQAPVTRMATAAIIRETLLKAKRYNEDIKKAEDNEDYDMPDLDYKSEALLPVIRGELPVHIHAHRADDICTAIRIGNEFSLDYRLVHCTDGILVADKLKKEKAAVFVGPFMGSRSKPELKNLTPKTCSVLNDAGLDIAIITDHPEIPEQYLRLCAILAVKYGLSKDAAMKAVTVNPAKLCGIYDKVGSIASGKDADFVIFDGDFFDIMSNVKAVFVNGNLVL